MFGVTRDSAARCKAAAGETWRVRRGLGLRFRGARAHTYRQGCRRHHRSMSYTLLHSHPMIAPQAHHPQQIAISMHTRSLFLSLSLSLSLAVFPPHHRPWYAAGPSAIAATPTSSARRAMDMADDRRRCRNKSGASCRGQTCKRAPKKKSRSAAHRRSKAYADR